jgi:hypothetical protein
MWCCAGQKSDTSMPSCSDSFMAAILRCPKGRSSAAIGWLASGDGAGNNSGHGQKSKHLPYHYCRAFAILHNCAALDPHTTGGLANANKKVGNRMPSSRWLATLTIPMLAGAALVGSSAIAIANPQDDAYLAQLRAVGLDWPPKSDEAVIGVAHLVCYDLTWGWAPQQIADDIHATLAPKGMSLLDVGSIVNAAHSTYCPGNVCDAPQLCT